MDTPLCIDFNNDNFQGAIAAKNRYSNTLLPTNVESVTCSGNEDSIMDCVVEYGGEDSECNARADAGVICQGKLKHSYLLLC